MSVLFFISMLNMPNTTGLLHPGGVKRSSVVGVSAGLRETLEDYFLFVQLAFTACWEKLKLALFLRLFGALSDLFCS